MYDALAEKVNPTLVPHAATAAELMTANPLSIREEATVTEAIRFLSDRGISAAPVIGVGGRPVGVVSQTDIIVHERERNEPGCSAPPFFHDMDLTAPAKEGPRTGEVPPALDPMKVRDIMTPTVFSVSLETPANQVVDYLVGLNVHRLFVVNKQGVLVGVISALDALRRLQQRAGCESDGCPRWPR
jgi:CBS domain-containing protein